MNRKLTAWMMASCMVLSMAAPAYAAGSDATGQDETTETAAQQTKACTQTEGCTLEDGHEGGCALPQPEACAKTEGCTLEDGHEGGCALPQPEACAKTEGCTLEEGHEGGCVLKESDPPSAGEDKAAASPAALDSTAAAPAADPLSDVTKDSFLHPSIWKAVKEAAGRTNPDDDSALTTVELAKVKSLDLSNKKIIALTGIQNLTNLTELNLSNNKIEDLSFLTPLTKLETLDLSENTGKNGGGLDLSGNNFNLRTASLKILKANNCNAAAISGLAGLTGLTHLELSGNASLSDVSALASMPSMVYLDLSGCNIEKLGLNGKMTSLQTLVISGNKNFRDLNELPGGAALKTLNASGCKIEDLSKLPYGYTALEEVDLSGNIISIIQKLPTTVKKLNLENNRIETVSGISSMSGLTLADLKLDGNLITDKGKLKAALPSSLQNGADSWLTSTIESQKNYTPPVPGETVNKTSLKTKIELAEEAKLDITVSGDGTDVESSVLWVTQDALDTLNQAIKAAQAVVTSTTADQTAVDDAANTLSAAIKTFNGAKEHGKKANKSELLAALNRANDAKTGVASSTDGSDVPKTQKYVTPTEMKALDDAIKAAEAVYGSATATQAEADKAVTDLDSAVATFNTAKKDGSQTTCTITFVSAHSTHAAISGITPYETVKLPTPSYSGYRFDGWFSDGTLYTHRVTDSTAITQNMTLTAKWTYIPPSDNSSSGGNSGGSSGGSGGSGGGGSSSYNKGASVFSQLTSTINSILKGNLTGVSGVSNAAGKAAEAGTPVTQAAAEKAVSSAVSLAKQQGGESADVLFRNGTAFSAGVLDAIASQAQKSGLKANIVADTMNSNGAVEARIRVPASAAAKLGKDLNLSARVGNSAVEKHFAKYYANEIAVVSMGQKGSYGLPVSVAVKTALSGADPKDLHIYSYDAATNTFHEVPQENLFIDANGYIHFTTDIGNDIIISAGALERR